MDLQSSVKGRTDSITENDIQQLLQSSKLILPSLSFHSSITELLCSHFLLCNLHVQRRWNCWLFHICQKYFAVVVNSLIFVEQFLGSQQNWAYSTAYSSRSHILIAPLLHSQQFPRRVSHLMNKLAPFLNGFEQICKWQCIHIIVLYRVISLPQNLPHSPFCFDCIPRKTGSKFCHNVLI